MASRTGKNAVDLWAELIANEEEELNDHQSRFVKPQEPEIALVYRRIKAPCETNNNAPVQRRQSNSSSGDSNRLSLALPQRISWNRSLSTRGRTSIAVAACADYQPQKGKTRRKQKPPLPRGKVVPPPSYDKERAYFQEVDAFELMEESPSPKKPATWIMGIQTRDVVLPHLSSVLRRWLIARRINSSHELPHSLTKILETPGMAKEPHHGVGLENSSLKTLQQEASLSVNSGLQSMEMCNFTLRESDICHRGPLSDKVIEMDEDGCQDIEAAVHELSLTSRPSACDVQSLDPFFALLTACGQSGPSKFSDILSNYCDPESIVKVGEGTYGEAFKVGDTVCKIVPFDGDLRVNGEVQKRSEEVFEEVILSRTLNHLRGLDGNVMNACTTFIQTINLRVCEGAYDAALIRAWEEWERNHDSLNDHPKEFPEKQRYVMFIQEHGGKDLESFVLLNFDEARSLLAQVTFALAVAEAASEFEHRDLHWGNILLSRKGSASLLFILEGKKVHIKTMGLSISIIDFTLSRMNTGEDILFLDLSSDPELFEGPKGDKQSETYRKMKEVTEEYWEGSFPKTNVLWLQYLVDILLLKKSYDRTSKDERELRSLKKRLNAYDSAKEATGDPFFTDLIVNDV